VIIRSVGQHFNPGPLGKGAEYTVGSARLYNLRRAVTNHSAQLQTGLHTLSASSRLDVAVSAVPTRLLQHLTSSHPSIRGPPHKQLIVAHLVKELHSFSCSSEVSFTMKTTRFSGL
jgi:hypothetical protein